MADNRFYFKEWRKYRGLTQDQVVDRLVGLDDKNLPQTAASLSRLENGKQPYAQPILEALADIYGVEPSDLLKNNPEKEGEIVDLLHVLDERQRKQAMSIIRTLAAS